MYSSSDTKSLPMKLPIFLLNFVIHIAEPPCLPLCTGPMCAETHVGGGVMSAPCLPVGHHGHFDYHLQYVLIGVSCNLAT